MKAELEYPKEGEREEADLTELIKDGHIALSELPSPPPHKCVAWYCTSVTQAACPFVCGPLPGPSECMNSFLVNWMGQI